MTRGKMTKVVRIVIVRMRQIILDNVVSMVKRKELKK